VIFDDEDGTRYFICERRDEMTGEPVVDHCGCGAVSTKLCDAAKSPGKTCDEPICDACATTIGETGANGRDACFAQTFDRQAKHPKGKTLAEQRAYKASKIRHRDALRAVMDEGDTIDLCPSCKRKADLAELIAKGASIP
jgi:hypothetical protein